MLAVPGAELSSAQAEAFEKSYYIWLMSLDFHKNFPTFVACVVYLKSLTFLKLPFLCNSINSEEILWELWGAKLNCTAYIFLYISLKNV